MISILCGIIGIVNCIGLEEQNSILKHDEKQPIIEVTPSISHNYIGNTSPTKIGVLFDITTSNSTLISPQSNNNNEFIREPYELAIVLDRSGSMWGDKIEKAKLAIIAIIDNMIEGDIIHIIQYDHNVQVLVENGEKQSQSKIIEKVNNITPGGATNLFGGLKAAYDALTRSMNIRKSDHIISHSRIFLFSDGLLNSGITDQNKILDEISQWKNEMDITICTFGIGYDFDRKLMTSIAETARGDFFFIDSAESISKVIEVARKDAASLVGTEAILIVSTMQNETENVNIKFSNMFDRALLDEKQFSNYNQIDIRELRAGDSKYIIIELLVDANNLKAKTLDVMQWTLEYNDVLTKQRKSIEGRINVEFVDEDDKRLQSDDNINNHVKIFWKLNEIRMIDKDILDDIENEDFDSAINKRKLLFGSIETFGESAEFALFSSEPTDSPSYAPSMSPTSDPTSFLKTNMRMMERMKDEIVEQKVERIKEKRAKKQKIDAKEKEDILMDYSSRYQHSRSPTSGHLEL